MEHAADARPRGPAALARHGGDDHIDHFWADRGILCFWVFAALAVAGALTAMRAATPWYVWAMPILMFFSVVFLVVETPRYRTPMDPFLVLLATAALVTAARRVLAQTSIGRSSLRTRTSAPATPAG